MADAEPADFESKDKIETVTSYWIEKVLGGFVAPHFLFVVTKIDQIGNKEEKLCAFQTMLKTTLEAKYNSVMQSIEKQHDTFEQQLVELRKSVLENEQQNEDYQSSLIKTEEILKRKIKLQL